LFTKKTAAFTWCSLPFGWWKLRHSENQNHHLLTYTVKMFNWKSTFGAQPKHPLFSADVYLRCPLNRKASSVQWKGVITVPI